VGIAKYSKKTVDFDYNINGQTLETVTSNPYLAAELTNTMSWVKQVQKVVTKGNKALGFSQSVEYVFGDEGPKRCWHTQAEVGQAQGMLVSLPPLDMILHFSRS
jgi:hypothetical protein